jgi:hypothetical protein
MQHHASGRKKKPADAMSALTALAQKKILFWFVTLCTLIIMLLLVQLHPPSA